MIEISSNLDLRHSPCTTSDGLFATSAFPDSYGVSLDSVLAAESADVSGVLCDFHLLDLFSEGSAVSVRKLLEVFKWNDCLRPWRIRRA